MACDKIGNEVKYDVNNNSTPKTNGAIKINNKYNKNDNANDISIFTCHTSFTVAGKGV